MGAHIQSATTLQWRILSFFVGMFCSFFLKQKINCHKSKLNVNNFYTNRVILFPNIFIKIIETIYMIYVRLCRKAHTKKCSIFLSFYQCGEWWWVAGYFSEVKVAWKASNLLHTCQPMLMKSQNFLITRSSENE